MTLTLRMYMDLMQNKRSQLEDLEDEFQTILNTASDNFLVFTVKSKPLGVKNLAIMSEALSHKGQKKFLKWYYKPFKVRKKKDIQNYLDKYFIQLD